MDALQSDRPTILCVIGTRPEAIKMAPVVLELKKYSAEVNTLLVSTGQHKEILLAALKTFGLMPDEDLEIMLHGQSLAGITSRALEGLDRLIERSTPAMIVAQGDTTTTFVAALAGFYRRVPFAHVEAGLRTTSIDNPFPEEFNRRAVGLVAELHFPPTRWAAENLEREGKSPDSIVVTGNTGIDAVLSAASASPEEWYPSHPGRVVLLTTHRRENWGEPQKAIARAMAALVEEFEDILLVVPMHPNPNVRAVLKEKLDGMPRVELIEPPEYEKFVKLMQRSSIIFTDSGGVQEEAPSFGIPVLVLRTTTERPEGVAAGTAKLVGTDYAAILGAGQQLLGDRSIYNAMAKAVSPYGDGRAAERIRYRILNRLGIASEEAPAWT